jgi:hypothetical protein
MGTPGCWCRHPRLAKTEHRWLRQRSRRLRHTITHICDFHFLTFSSFHHHLPLPFSLRSLPFSFFLLPMSTSFSANALIDDDPGQDSDDNLDEVMDSSVPPPSRTQLSLPSGLSITMISRLTHDELRHNPKFCKYVSLVDALLLSTRSNPGEPFFFPLSPHVLTTFYL